VFVAITGVCRCSRPRRRQARSTPCSSPQRCRGDRCQLCGKRTRSRAALDQVVGISASAFSTRSVAPMRRCVGRTARCSCALWHVVLRSCCGSGRRLGAVSKLGLRFGRDFPVRVLPWKRPRPRGDSAADVAAAWGRGGRASRCAPPTRTCSRWRRAASAPWLLPASERHRGRPVVGDDPSPFAEGPSHAVPGLGLASGHSGGALFSGSPHADDALLGVRRDRRRSAQVRWWWQARSCRDRAPRRGRAGGAAVVLVSEGGRVAARPHHSHHPFLDRYRSDADDGRAT
jgi:hypothetical protein